MEMQTRPSGYTAGQAQQDTTLCTQVCLNIWKGSRTWDVPTAFFTLAACCLALHADTVEVLCCYAHQKQPTTNH